MRGLGASRKGPHTSLSNIFPNPTCKLCENRGSTAIVNLAFVRVSATKKAGAKRRSGQGDYPNATGKNKTDVAENSDHIGETGIVWTPRTTRYIAPTKTCMRGLGASRKAPHTSLSNIFLKPTCILCENRESTVVVNLAIVRVSATKKAKLERLSGQGDYPKATGKNNTDVAENNDRLGETGIVWTPQTTQYIAPTKTCMRGLGASRKGPHTFLSDKFIKPTCILCDNRESTVVVKLSFVRVSATKKAGLERLSGQGDYPKAT